ncbi:hypothetical protein CONPUDRAFT_168928 [Coniophora puteana RWD-64-598 SS2]|uniref:DLIC-domain-containing protein n=1 Tax=Coniophora puteana (strain RWD-64-598) TaxID=741705 RepID=A0A5M3MBI8_CONPW|nr:uncharacterized protein CONPUDRAFT_168928 [Coniophora puteana RWD-64-598 SS2]EIW76376.1 hypothetical protein CONPUDRAFT_168928 [Coniophora puteana RWD-64-598 SS2]
MELPSRPSSPDAPPADLWSSILDSVSSTRSIPSKQIVLLGRPQSGKSTLASALLRKPLSEDEEREDARVDFALGYDWADVRDDADEDTLARLSVYTVPSGAPAYSALLPHFLPPRASLPHTLVMIVLDWTKPWTFIDDLELWLRWVEAWARGDGGAAPAGPAAGAGAVAGAATAAAGKPADGARELEIAREENRERLQHHLQHYTEPSADALPASTLTSGTVLPLGAGTLTHNAAGVPVVVVCTKADLIDEESDGTGGVTGGMGGMVKGKGGEWEERTDSVMQVLRTICLKYGASLFYTTPQPSTLQSLRQHALHLLFMPAASAPAMAGEAPAPTRNPFPFEQKPNTLDRDQIVVPAGWDSWGKIGVLREGFEARVWGDAWEADLEGPAPVDGEDEQQQNQQGGGGGQGARRMYRLLVPDQGAKPAALPPFNNPTPEQAFLARHYDDNAKKPDRDPRGAFLRNPTTSAAEAAVNGAAGGTGAGAGAGIVGPLGNSSFSLPNVERALSEMEAGVGGLGASGGPGAAGPVANGAGAGSAGAAGASVVLGASGGSGAGMGVGPDRRSSGSRGAGVGRPGGLGQSVGPGASPGPGAGGQAGRSTSPALGGGPGGGGGGPGQTQHEVLQNFFQSLLSSRERAAGVAGAGAGGVTARSPPPRGANGTPEDSGRDRSGSGSGNGGGGVEAAPSSGGSAADESETSS